MKSLDYTAKSTTQALDSLGSSIYGLYSRNYSSVYGGGPERIFVHYSNLDADRRYCTNRFALPYLIRNCETIVLPS